MNPLTLNRRANDSLSVRAYRFLLLTYPRTFRAEYGPHMIQVFRDSYRTELRTHEAAGVLRLWLRTLPDLVQSAAKEHLETERSTVKNLRRDLIAVIGCIAIIVFAFWLLSYGRRHEIAGILTIGRALDAFVTVGVVGNLLIFALVKITRMNPLRTALWTLLSVTVILLALTEIIGSRVDPQFRPVNVLAGYIVSFLVWFGLHSIWSKSSRQFALSSEQ